MNQNIISSDAGARVRALESKYNLLAEHVLTINRNMIDEYKNLTEDLKTVSKQFKELKIEIEKIKTTVKSFANEFDFFAKKQDLKVLEKYINLWNPMEFITNKELDKILESQEISKARKSRRGISKF